MLIQENKYIQQIHKKLQQTALGEFFKWPAHK